MSVADLIDQLEDVVIDVDHPSATPEQIALLNWARDNPIESCRPPVVAGRYKAPTPGTDKVKAHTRVTNYAKTLDDLGGLTTWQNRLLTRGLASSTELVQQVVAAITNDDTPAIDRAIGSALHAAGSKLAADIGTALHLACEHHDAGSIALDSLPDVWLNDVAAYGHVIGSADITPVHSEVAVYVPGINCIGTIDSLARVGDDDGPLVVCDIKTGSKVDRLSYAVQLAIYSQATHRWTPDGWAEVPAIDQTRGYIIHLPAGTGTCEIVDVDLETAAGYIDLATQIRAARRNARNLFAPVTAVIPDEMPSDDEPVKVGDVLGDVLLPERTQWIVDRIGALKADHPERVDALRARWPLGVERKPPWTHDDLTKIDAALSAVEPSFPGNDPAVIAEREAKAAAVADAIENPPAPPAKAPAWTNPDNGPAVDTEDADALRAAIAALGDDHMSAIRRWVREGREQERPWSVPGEMSTRSWAIGRAALRCLKSLHLVSKPDDRTRAALAYVIGEDVQPAWLTGAVMGSLTIEQATQLADVADAYGRRDDTVKAVINGLVDGAAA